MSDVVVVSSTAEGKAKDTCLAGNNVDLHAR